MKHLYRLAPEVILLLFVMLFLVFRSPEQTWDRVINSDGKGYYAYLPAIFIYHDLKYKFVEDYEKSYYPSNRSGFKEFRLASGTENFVNKYFPGMAIIWLPFFFGAHLFAWLLGFPMDGYSLPYQYAIAVSVFFFLWLGLRIMMSLLKKFGAPDAVAALIILVIGLGTNIVYFALVEASMTHVYSFALITLFILLVHKLFSHYKLKWFTWSLSLLALICIIRPTNGLIIMLVPFIAGNTEALTRTYKNIVSEGKKLVFSFIPATVLIFIPFLLWKLQSDHWLLYSYADEKLDFLNPNFIKILFSYNRGWFLYTPLAFVSLFGFAGLYRENKYRFWWLATFLITYIFVASCWHVWYYASKCGQRVFIDIYFIIGLLLYYLINNFRHTLMKALITMVLLVLMVYNLLLSWQHHTWIFPPIEITGEIYRDSFMSTERRAKVYLPSEGIVQKKSFFTDMEKPGNWMNTGTRNNSVSKSGRWSSGFIKFSPYGIGLESSTDTVFSSPAGIIFISGWILSHPKENQGSVVADFRHEGKSFSYNPFYLKDYITAGQWTYFECAWHIPKDIPMHSLVRIYFYNPSIYPLYADDVRVEFLSMKDQPEYRKIEGVLLPF